MSRQTWNVALFDVKEDARERCVGTKRKRIVDFRNSSSLPHEVLVRWKTAQSRRLILVLSSRTIHASRTCYMRLSETDFLAVKAF